MQRANNRLSPRQHIPTVLIPYCTHKSTFDCCLRTVFESAFFAFSRNFGASLFGCTWQRTATRGPRSHHQQDHHGIHGIYIAHGYFLQKSPFFLKNLLGGLTRSAAPSLRPQPGTCRIRSAPAMSARRKQFGRFVRRPQTFGSHNKDWAYHVRNLHTNQDVCPRAGYSFLLLVWISSDSRPGENIQLRFTPWKSELFSKANCFSIQFEQKSFESSTKIL